MALDALEKERLRRKMAVRMAAFIGKDRVVSCVSAHVYDDKQFCELSEQQDTQEILVIKNRAGKKMKISPFALKEMIRFQVMDVEDFAKWLEKLKEIWGEHERRKLEEKKAELEQRKALEKKVILRKRPSPPT